MFLELNNLVSPVFKVKRWTRVAYLWQVDILSNEQRRKWLDKTKAKSNRKRVENESNEQGDLSWDDVNHTISWTLRRAWKAIRTTRTHSKTVQIPFSFQFHIHSSLFSKVKLLIFVFSPVLTGIIRMLMKWVVMGVGRLYQLYDCKFYMFSFPESLCYKCFDLFYWRPLMFFLISSPNVLNQVRQCECVRTCVISITLTWDETGLETAKSSFHYFARYVVLTKKHMKSKLVSKAAEAYLVNQVENVKSNFVSFSPLFRSFDH